MTVKAALIGAGLRGRHVYGRYAVARPERLRIVAVAEPDAGRRAAAAAEHDLPGDRVFDDGAALLARPRLADAAIVATGDTGHVEPALGALARGYHVLLEKPIAPTAAECVRVVEAAERAGRILQIAHVLRYTELYRRARNLVAAGALGRVLTVDMTEHVAFWHMTHSYVRGKFRSRAVAAPILLAKSCHDLDLLLWLVGRPARAVASFGGLSEFCPERAPRGAPERCTDGCPVQDACPHDAVRFYLGPDARAARRWPWLDVSPDPSREARRRALESGRYGRCVYRCDNDALDHQVVAVEFEGGARATFALDGHAPVETRTLRVVGSAGKLHGSLAEGRLEWTRLGSDRPERLELGGDQAGHFGGDLGLLDDFTRAVEAGAAGGPVTSGRVALESHLLGFAAEDARRERCVVDLAEWRRRLGAAPPSR